MGALCLFFTQKHHFKMLSKTFLFETAIRAKSSFARKWRANTALILLLGLAMGISPTLLLAQSPPNPLICGTIVRPLPPVPFNNEPLYSDRFGNLYTHTELQEGLYTATHHCDNIEDFVLNFVDDPTHPFTDEERERVCDVFTYLSGIIQRPTQGARAIIEITKGELPAEQGALGTAFFPNQCGVGHSLVHQVLFTGQGEGNLVHGCITINSAVTAFFTGADPAIIPPNQFDFQTGVLHEALHVLGFASQITPTGNAQGFYTIWDLNLRNATGDFLVQSTPSNAQACCAAYNINPAFGANWANNIWNQNCGPNNLRFDVGALPPVNGEYPNAPMNAPTFENVLSHLDRSCGTEHYVMNSGIPPGMDGVQRTLTATETAIMCRLGYDIANGCDPDCMVVAADDGPIYIPAGGAANIEVAGNDFPQPALGVPANTTITFLPNCGNHANLTIAPLQPGSTTFRVSGNIPGAYTFCYTISACNGRRCDVGRVTVVITNPAIAMSCQNVGDCELNGLGDFELFSSDEELRNMLSRFSFTPGNVNSSDLFIGPLSINLTSTCNKSLTNASAPSGSHFVGVIGSNIINGREGLGFPLCRPVFPGMRGRVTFQANSPYFCLSPQIRVEFSELPPVMGQVVYNNPGIVGPQQDVPIIAQQNGNPIWATYTVDFFNETNVCWNYLYLSALIPPLILTASPNHVIFIDDVHLNLQNRFNEVFDITGPTVSTPMPCPGELVTVELQLCNPPNCTAGGPYENPNIAVEAMLPAGLSFVPSPDFPAPNIIVPRSSIGLNQCRTLRLTARVDNGVTIGQALPLTLRLNANCYQPLSLPASVTPTGVPATLSFQIAENSGAPNDGILCEGSGASATLTALTTGAGYLWSTGATTQSITVAPTATQSYTVTVSGPGLCARTDFVSIVVRPCTQEPPACACPPGANSYSVPGSTSLSATILPNTISNGCISINGTFRINRPSFLIENSTVIMGPGAEIVVEPGRSLTLRNNTAIRGCGTMWRGIRVDRGRLTLTGNQLIRDAEYAVNLESAVFDPSININGNTFNQNYVGIYVPPPPAGQTRTANALLMLPVDKNVFRCDAPLVARYPGQSPVLGDWALAGAYILDLPGGINFTGEQTLFDGLRNGILAERSVVTVGKATFQNLRDIPGLTSGTASAYNTAVRCDDCRQLNVLATKMYGCRTGIRAFKSNLKAEGNLIESTAPNAPTPPGLQGVTAISAGFCDNKRVLITKNNQITTSGNGIVLSQAQMPLQLFVLDNTIRMMPGAVRAGIQVSSCRMTNVSRNTVTSTSATQRYLNGMTILNSSVCDFIGNKFFNGNYGIQNSGGLQNYFIGNEVRPDPDPSILRPFHAFLAENSAEYYCNNKANSSATGFWFKGACTASDYFLCSEIKNSSPGLFLWADLSATPKQYTVIGTQEHTGNTWISSNAYHGADNQFIINQSRITITPSQLPPWNTAIGMVGPWFLGNNSGAADCSDCGSTRYPEPSVVSEPPKAAARPVTAALAERTAAEGGFESGAMNWMSQQQLYERLLDSPESVGAAAEFGAFVEQSRNHAIGQLHELRQKIAGNNPASNSLRIRLADAQAALEKRIEEALLLQTIGADPMATYLKLAEVAWYAEEAEQLEVRWAEAGEAARNALLSENTGIESSNGLAANEKALNHLVLQHRLWQGARPAPSVLDAVKTIADKCPFTDGFAVYAARAWYSAFNPEAFWPDTAGCQAQDHRGMPLAQRAEKSVLVSPNPAGDHLFVQFPLPCEFETRFELRDLSGRIVTWALIPLGEQVITVDINTLQPGAYLYTFKEKGWVYKTGKIIIIH